MDKGLSKIEIKILHAMHKRLVYGKHHKRIETIMHSCKVKSHKRGKVKKAIYSLIKKGFIIWAKRSEKAIQLNKDKYKEIEQILRDNIWLIKDK